MIGDDHNAGHTAGRVRRPAHVRAPTGCLRRCKLGAWHLTPGNCLMGLLLLLAPCAGAQESATAKGGIRGAIYDADFNAPLSLTRVTVQEANRTVITGEDGNYSVADLTPGVYTMVFIKEGFLRETRINVLVPAGAFAEVDARLFGEFTDMDELVVSDIDLGGTSEAGLLNLRAQSVNVMDSVGADLMSRAAAGTAIAAMRLVTGASVQDGKYVVIRGLGDRYTSTLLNGVRLPTSDKDKRAVQLDQFPASIIESIQVNKTFMPDQQGDASGGSVNIVTKSLPDARVLSASVSIEYDTEATGNADFKTPVGGRNEFGGVRSDKNLLFWNPGNMSGPRGHPDQHSSSTLRNDAPPPNSGFKFAVGDSFALGEEWEAGGLLNGSYGQKYRYREGVKDKVVSYTGQAVDTISDPDSMKLTETSADEQLWSSGLTLGLKNEAHELKFTGIYTHLTRMKTDIRYEYPITPSVTYTNNRRRVITTSRQRGLDWMTEYAENGNGTLQLAGKHKFENLHDLEIDWTASYNVSESTEPDRQQFAGFFQNQTVTDLAGNPISAQSTTNISGILQRRWQDTREMSRQWQCNAMQPFTVLEQEGYLRTGFFGDWLERQYRNRIFNQNFYVRALDEYDFSNFGSEVDAYPWSSISPDSYSTEYDGVQQIVDYYAMLRAPLPEWLDLIGGARLEQTLMQTEVRTAAPNMFGNIFVSRVVYDQSAGGYVLKLDYLLPEKEAGTTIDQVDLLPALALNFKAIPDVAIRLAWSQTVARPTFKELTPVLYAEPDPSKFFIGNQDLQMSALDNYDARVEWRPDDGDGLVAGSIFYKTIQGPIQYTTYSDPNPGSDKQYLFPENYGDAWLKGVEFEARKGLGFLLDGLRDFKLGANVTLQNSYVMYTDSLKQKLSRVGVANDGRIMDGQPAYLYNLNLLYDNDESGVSFGFFFNFKGETYVSGEGAANSLYVPNTIETPTVSLDATFGLKFAKTWRLGIEAKNLLNPKIETIYRGPMGDLPNSSYRQGRTYAMSLGCTF